MKYCSNCGKKIDENQKFCSNCGHSLSQKIEKEKTKAKSTSTANTNFSNNNESSEKLVCTYCGSNNIQVQIVPQNKNVGCSTIALYIILALTIVGIPLMILIVLLSGKKTVNKKYFVCQDCGRTINPYTTMYSTTSGNQITSTMIIALVFLFIFFIIVGILGFNCFLDDEKDKYSYNYVQDCTGLNKVKLSDIYHTYKSDENKAKKEYIDKPFVFEGKIFEIYEDKNMVRIDSEDISPKIYFNKSQVDKLDKYKKGDNIKLCGTVKTKSTIISVPIQVENATIIE